MRGGAAARTCRNEGLAEAGAAGASAGGWDGADAGEADAAVFLGRPSGAWRTAQRTIKKSPTIGILGSPSAR